MDCDQILYMVMRNDYVPNDALCYIKGVYVWDVSDITNMVVLPMSYTGGIPVSIGFWIC